MRWSTPAAAAVLVFAGGSAKADYVVVDPDDGLYVVGYTRRKRRCR